MDTRIGKSQIIAHTIEEDSHEAHLESAQMPKDKGKKEIKKPKKAKASI